MDMSQRITREESIGSWRLWVGIMTGPLAWITQVALFPQLVEMGCARGVRHPGEIEGVSLDIVIAIGNGLLILSTVVAGILAYGCIGAIRSRGTKTGRSLWMARVGVMSSILFLIIIAMGVAPQWFFRVCETAP